MAMKAGHPALGEVSAHETAYALAVHGDAVRKILDFVDDRTQGAGIRNGLVVRLVVRLAQSQCQPYVHAERRTYQF